MELKVTFLYTYVYFKYSKMEFDFHLPSLRTFFQFYSHFVHINWMSYPEWVAIIIQWKKYQIQHPLILLLKHF